VISPDELLDAIWPGLVVGQNSVYQAVAQLRRLLDDDSSDAKYIATVPRKGYRLIASVGAVAVPASGEASAAVETAASAAVPAQAPAQRRSRTIAAIVAGLVLAGAAAWFWQNHRDRPVAERPALAILPFADLSADKSNQVFCDGLAEEILNALARVPEVRITARNSAFQFRDRPSDVRDIGAKLGVTHVIEGSVRRDGSRIRVSAELINTRDGFQVWASSFDRPYSDVLAIQEDIARDVVAALEVKLSEQSTGRLAQSPTPKVNAYELYLLGRFQQQQRTPDSLARAIGYQRQALAIDPNFALAYAGLADAYMATYYYANQPLEIIARDIDNAVDKALAIDPELGEAYAARGVLRTEQWDLDNAVQDLKHAIAVKPNYADAYVRLGAAYEYRAEPRLALASFDQAAQLDPLHVVLHVRRCLTLQNMGRYPDADAACERAIVLQPNIPNALWARGLLALSQGHTGQAIAGYREAIVRAPRRADLHAQLGWLYLDIGMPEGARRSYDAAVNASPDDPTWKVERARFFLTGADPKALAGYLSALDLSDSRDPQVLLDYALMLVTAGDATHAHAEAERAATLPDYHADRALIDVWKTRWGRSTTLTLAEIALANGDRAGAEHNLAAVLDWIDRVEHGGQVWYGAQYLRASALALRGNPDQAMVALRKARDLGWRSGWWMRSDPALKTLRGRPDFAALLRAIDDINAVSRQGLPAT
jgi:TolB-like protein/Tfp pilus assembly protein PilF